MPQYDSLIKQSLAKHLQLIFLYQQCLLKLGVPFHIRQPDPQCLDRSFHVGQQEPLGDERKRLSIETVHELNVVLTEC